MKYFLLDKAWSREIDDSYIVLLDKVPRESELRRARIDIYGRNDKVVNNRIAELFAVKEE